MGEKNYYIRREEIQIVFKSDPILKDAALEKAKHEGMTLKAILCSAMRAYVNDELVMGMTRREEHYVGDDGPPKKEVGASGAKKSARKSSVKIVKKEKKITS